MALGAGAAAVAASSSATAVRRRSFSRSAILMRQVGWARSDSLRGDEELRLPVDRPFLITSSTPDSRALPSPPPPATPSAEESLSVLCLRERRRDVPSLPVSRWVGKNRRRVSG